MQSQEIRDLLGENYMTNQFLLKAELQAKYSNWCDMSVSSLLLQNKIVPILESEGLAEYVIRNVGFASLIEFRSKMGFKFSRVVYSEPGAKKTASATQHQVLMHDSAEPERAAIRSIEYRYWVDSHIFMTCVLSLEPLSQAKDPSTRNDDSAAEMKSKEKASTRRQADETAALKGSKTTTTGAQKGEKVGERRSDKIYVSYDLFAPSESLKSINREKILFNKKMEALDQIKFAKKRDEKQAR